MVVNAVSPRVFFTQFKTFENATARIPMGVGRMNGDRLVHKNGSTDVSGPLSPLIAPNGGTIAAGFLPASFRRRSELDEVDAGRDMYSEWIRVGAVVKGAREQAARGAGMASTDEGVRELSRVYHQRGRVSRDLGDREIATDELLRSAAMLLAIDGGGFAAEAGHDLYSASRCLGILGRHAAAAMVAEWAAFVEPSSIYYSGKAADEWLRSLEGRDDPDTMRFRVSRGILNSRRFPVRHVAFALHEASAGLFAAQGSGLEAAFELARGVDCAVDEDGVRGVTWSDVVRVLRNAGEFFGGQGADIEMRESLRLADMAKKIAEGA